MLCSVTIRVCERLATICGETHLAGIPCALIRLAGCSVGCVWCDTSYAQDPAAGEDTSRADLVAWVASTGLGLVLLTGGEPLEQAELPELAAELADAGKRVLVETSGTCDISSLPPPILRAVDVKGPSSGAQRLNRWQNLAVLRAGDAVKLPVRDREDYDHALDVIRRYRLRPPIELLLSPLAPLTPLELAGWMLADRLAGVRLNLQLHRLAWAELESRNDLK
jgi:7-carboxy-7-deazaguanine synthase